MHSRKIDQVWFIYIRNCGWDYETQSDACCKNWFPIQPTPMTWAEVVSAIATMDDTHREHAIVHIDYQHKYIGDNR